MAALTVTITAASAETKPVKPTPKQAAPAAAPAAVPQAAGGPLQVMESKDWKVAIAGSGKAKLCFAMTKPTKMEPASLKHGDVFLFVTSRTADGVRNEPSLQFGYPLKEGTDVVIDIDGKKFNFFAKGDGAWYKQTTEYAAFIDAMKKGKKMTAAGASARGNPTSYVFSLSGVTAAIEGAVKECK